MYMESIVSTHLVKLNDSIVLKPCLLGYAKHLGYDTLSCSFPFGVLAYTMMLGLFAMHFCNISLLAYLKNVM